ncbi:hydantoinase/oxoprolinase family protein [Streptomyces sp. DSM 41524]|uniref:Hydantoinase/oxoprolinase family protein n=1 Tax=Streptomyces asiaticus subsp. ignotus TaxID=3098222 RepID=A0ABU7QC21_9ACTN|nr:hydantoinase/oxoprolinase family protein [Streptomyces sp. DSM 41524]
MSSIIGVDIGGTFTDAFIADSTGRTWSAKTPSTPPGYAEGFLNALGELAESDGRDLAELLGACDYIVHGTTATLNALVVGDVATVGFLTTSGHSDSIRIMNLEGRYAGLSNDDIQDMVRHDKPAPLVPRRLVREITERVDYKGEIVVELDESQARQAITELRDAGADAFAVSLLWSFANPRHELRLRQLIEEIAPGTYVGLSSELSPRIREYPRSATTIMSTQVAPKLRNYLVPVEKRLRELGFTGALLVMQGSGGSVAAAEAPDRAITTIGSVLTGGVVGCTRLGARLGHPNIVSTDIGGTTFLVGLVVDGEPVMAPSTVVGRHTVSVPMVQVSTIGSGGGAVAWLDAGGNLRVGPRSAQAVPGPACYGNGGTEPTVTDADVVLGIVDPGRFLDGRRTLDVALAEEAIRSRIAEPLGLSVEDAAAAVYAIQNAQAADLLRQVVVNAGHDPRDFIVYAFGGAGPVHCAAYAADLGARQVLVPLGPMASAFSAYGLAASDVVLSAELSRPRTMPMRAAEMDDIFRGLEKELHARIAEQQVIFAKVSYTREVDVRYSLQLAELVVPVPGGEITEKTITALQDDFAALYERRYGADTGFADAGLQAVTFRMYAKGTLPFAPEFTVHDAVPAPAPVGGRRRALLDPEHGFQQVAVLDYRDLRPGHHFAGPAVLEAGTTTVAVPQGFTAEVDVLGNLLLNVPTTRETR